MKTIQFHTKFTFIPQNKSVGHQNQESEGDITVRQWSIIGVGTGWGARNMGTADGPQVLMDNIPPYFQQFPQTFTYWHADVLSFSNPYPLSAELSKIHSQHVFEMATALCMETKESILQGNLPLVLGGDHSMAIGTWSGIKAALKDEDIGLIWIDAHMDAHTPDTSPSLNVHGMPLAALLGQGETRFTNIGDVCPKLKPENLCLIGIRSFEEGEEALLKHLGVRVYSMKEVQERGFAATFQEARSKLKASRFGLSIDIDAFDPQEAPGTGTPEDFGLRFNEVKDALEGLAQDPSFLALEITEFNPHRDLNNMTCQLVWDLVAIITGENDDKE